jgi:hypothetical protein
MMNRNVRSVLPHLVLGFAFLGLSCADGMKVKITRDGGQADTAGPEQDGDKVDAASSSEDTSRVTDAAAQTTATITFHLMNIGTQTVYLRRECWYTMGVTSEADGRTYSGGALCGCDCTSASCQGGVECGQCAPTTGIAVEAGKNKDISWSAETSTMQSKNGPQGAFQCVAKSPISTGTYRLRITVYPTPEDAVARTNGKDVEISFLLTTANATVEVPIQ